MIIPAPENHYWFTAELNWYKISWIQSTPLIYLYRTDFIIEDQPGCRDLSVLQITDVEAALRPLSYIVSSRLVRVAAMRRL